MPPLLGSGVDRLGAELTARGCDWNVAEALGAGLCGRRGGCGMELFEEVLGGQDEEEVDDGGDEQEVDDVREHVRRAVDGGVRGELLEVRGKRSGRGGDRVAGHRDE